MRPPSSGATLLELALLYPKKKRGSRWGKEQRQWGISWYWEA